MRLLLLTSTAILFSWGVILILSSFRIEENKTELYEWWSINLYYWEFLAGVALTVLSLYLTHTILLMYL